MLVSFFVRLGIMFYSTFLLTCYLQWFITSYYLIFNLYSGFHFPLIIQFTLLCSKLATNALPASSAHLPIVLMATLTDKYVGSFSLEISALTNMNPTGPLEYIPSDQYEPKGPIGLYSIWPKWAQGHHLDYITSDQYESNRSIGLQYIPSDEYESNWTIGLYSTC